MRFFSRRAARQPGAAQARQQLPLFLGRLAKLGVLIGLLLVAGMLGFTITEDTSLWDGFLWTLDTIATVGSIPSPETTGGQVLKVLLIVLGVGTLFYALVAVTEFFVAGEVTGLLEERRRQRKVDALSDHYLVCGFGRVGRQVVRDLRAAGAEYVVVDPNPDSIEAAAAAGVPHLEGGAADEHVLRQAGIERARAVIACVDSDAENVFITLTVRELRPDLTIVARASGEESEQKLRRAGAQRVVSPYKSSGSEMARLALHPQVAGVVDVAPEYRMEEIEVTDGCPGAGRPVADVAGSAVIAAVQKADGELVPQPSGDLVLQPGDVVIAMGTAAAMDRLEALFAPKEAVSSGEASA
ncbi:MAG TPA: TrkA family potassium uptake protein [Gaiellaceae bacterium]|nr:TrkA family potassium uptake protein [Gaiellaceae bacterium]